MKKSLIVSLFCAFTMMALSSCNPQSSEFVPQEEEKVYKINYSSITLSLESSFELVVSLNGVPVEATWKASNDNVTIDKGFVTGQKIGDSLVTASIDSTELTCDVKVVSQGTIPSVKLNCNDQLVLENGDIFTVVPILYWNSTETEPTSVDFSISGSCVTGELSTNRVLLTAVSSGEGYLAIIVLWHEIPLYTKADIKVK